MRHDIHLIRTDTGTEYILPVPPSSIGLSDAQDYATEYVQGVGDVHFPGLREPSQIVLADMLIPAQEYAFAASSAANPHAFADELTQAMHDGVIFRYIEAGSTVNRRVFLSAVEREERDGTDDLYLTLTLQEYTDLDAPEVTTAAPGSVLTTRTDDFGRTAASVYEVRDGDTWWRIADSWYRDGSLADALAAYNSTQADLSPEAGMVITLPPSAALSGEQAAYSADCGYTPALSAALDTMSAAVSESDTAPDAADPELYAVWLQLHNQALTPLSYLDWLALIGGERY